MVFHHVYFPTSFPTNELLDHTKNETNVYYYWNLEDCKVYEQLLKEWKLYESKPLLDELARLTKMEEEELINIDWLDNNSIIHILNDKNVNDMYHWWDFNYLLNVFYKRDKNSFYRYLSSNKPKYAEEGDYGFFTNFPWLMKVYVSNNERNNAIKLFDELLDFAKLLIL